MTSSFLMNHLIDLCIMEEVLLQKKTSVVDLYSTCYFPHSILCTTTFVLPLSLVSLLRIKLRMYYV